MDEVEKKQEGTNENKKSEGSITEFAKKAFSMRGAISSIIPKEVINILKEQFDIMKNEIMKIISKEFKDFLERANLNAEVQRILSGLIVEIKTEISFQSKEEKEISPKEPSSEKVVEEEKKEIKILKRPQKKVRKKTGLKI